MIDRYYRVGDFVDEFFKNRTSISAPTSYKTYEFIDTEKYEVVLKKDFVEKEIARKEEELRQIETRHRQCEDRLREEISGLKEQRREREK